MGLFYFIAHKTQRYKWRETCFVQFTAVTLTFYTSQLTWESSRYVGVVARMTVRLTDENDIKSWMLLLEMLLAY